MPFTGAARTARPAIRGGVVGQVALILCSWLAYSFARALAGDDVAAAVRNGRFMLSLDQSLGFGWTLGLNHWGTAHAVIAIPFAFEYASLHYLVTPLVLVWLWRCRPEAYGPGLTALLLMTAVGLICYIAVPVAPPRLLPDTPWIDTMRAWQHVGWWGGAASAPAGFEHFTDQYAAMPSLHVGWAVWCACTWQRAERRVVRWLAWWYPISIAVAVVITANHYVLDVVVGALISLAACLAVSRLPLGDRDDALVASAPGDTVG